MEQQTYTMTLMITTTAGGNSNYLFPGMVRHGYVGTGDLIGGTAYFDWTKVKANGYPLEGPRTRFNTDFFGDDVGSDGKKVFGSAVSGWRIRDSSDPQVVYATIQFSHQNGAAQVPIQFGNGTTPDKILTSLSGSTHAKFVLLGNTGNDTLTGSRFADTLDGGAGRDKMYGGRGSDSYTVDNRHDKISDSGGKNDYVTTTVSYKLNASIENLYGDGLKGIDLTGNNKSNWIVGTNGKNVIKGLDGDDKLWGGLGHDTLTGGAGHDRFYFNDAYWSGDADKVTDFKRGTDEIWLSSFAFDVNPSYTKAHEKLDADAFHASKNGRAHDPDDRILYDWNDGKLYYDEDGTGSAQRILLATFSHNPGLHASDFEVYIV